MNSVTDDWLTVLSLLISILIALIELSAQFHLLE